MENNNEIKPCEDCGSTNTYLSENGYDSSIICKVCGHEEHTIHLSRFFGFEELA